MTFAHLIPFLYILMIALAWSSADIRHIYALIVSLCVITVVLRFC